MLTANAQTIIWAKNYGGGKKDKGRDIGVDSIGNSYITGFFTDSVMFDNITLNTVGDTTDEDIFVLKLDVDGIALWAHSMGNGISEHSDFPFGFSVNSSGYSVITGDCENYLLTDDGTNIPGIGNKDIFMALYDPQGNLQWGKVGGGAGIDRGTGVFIDDDGKIYCTGNTVGSFSIFGDYDYVDSTLSHHVYVAQYDLDGALQWQRIYTSQTNFESRDITADTDSTLYTGGNFSDVISLDDSTFSAIGSEDGWLIKLDKNDGSFKWAKTFGSNDPASNESAYAIALDTFGNFYVTTVFNNDILFDGNITSTGAEHNIAVACFNPDGNYSWTNVIKGGATGNFSVFCLGLLAEDYVILTGCFAGSDTVGIDAGIVITPYGDSTYSDAFIAAFDPATGTAAWATHMGGESTDAGYGIAGNHTGTGYAAGNFRIEGTFGPFDLVSDGISDVYVIKFYQALALSTTDLSGNTVTAYPNPTNGELSVMIPAEANSLKIINAFGQIVRAEKVDALKMKMISMEQFLPGVYFLQFSSKDASYFAKVVKQ